MIAALFSVVLLASGTPTATAETATEAAVAAPVEKAEKQKKICKTDPANTGSRMKKQICLTAVEWEKHNSGRSAGDLKTVGGR